MSKYPEHNIENEALLRSMFDNIDGSICYVDIHKRLVLFNKGFENSYKILAGKNPEVGAEVYGFLPPDEKKKRDQIIDRVLTGKRETIEVSYIRDGREIFFKTSLNPVFSGTEVVGATSYSINQTVAKLAEVTRRKADARFRTMVENSFDGIIIYDEDLHIIYRSPSMGRLTGWTDEERMQYEGIDLLHPDDFSLVNSAVEQSKLHPGTRVNEVIRLKTKADGYVWVEVTINNLSKEQDINGFIFIFRNISERKNAEEKLTKALSRLNYHINNTPVGVIEHDKDYKISFWSKRSEELFGWREEEVLGKRPDEFFIHKNDVGKIFQKWDSLKLGSADKTAVESRVYTKEGKLLYCRWHSSLLKDQAGDVDSILSIVRDFTDQRKIEEDLREAEIKFRSLAEKSLVGIYIIQDGKFAYANPKFAEIFGYEVSELVNSIPIEKVFDDNYQKQVEGKGLKDEIGSVYYETTGRNKNGDVIDVEVFGNITEFNGLPGIIGTIIDITKRKEAEVTLRISEANLHTIFDNTEVAYTLVDKNFGLLSYNEAALHFARNILNVEPKTGDYLLDYMPAHRIDTVAKALSNVLKGHNIGYEISYGQPDGSLKWFHVRIMPILGKQQEIFGIMVAITNITERKAIELHREKITSDLIYRNEALQQFTYIISHNLRAPVANIMGLSDILSNFELNEEEQKETVAGIALATQKLDEVIKDLNSILQVKDEAYRNKEVVVFSELAEEITSGINQYFKNEEVLIKTNFTAIDEFFTIRSYLQSIFYNLISNSIKFRRPGVQPIIEVTSEFSDNKITLLFRDNGIGFDSAKIGDKLFELYKRFHLHVEGKGMGLFMVKTQIESLGGKISVASQINEGTEFKIEFPLTEA